MPSAPPPETSARARRAPGRSARVRAGEDALRLVEGLDLLGARGPPHLEILEQEVALGVKLLLIGPQLLEVRQRMPQVAGEDRELGVEAGALGRLVGDGGHLGL